MDVESGLSSVLRSNAYRKERTTTEDYVKLKDPLRLEAWELRLIGYPDWPIISPFRGWSAEKATQSLKWYDAYNQTKHRREEHLQLAKLRFAIDAVAACLILAAAQFGPHHWEAGTLQASAYAQTVFAFDTKPQWAPELRYWEVGDKAWAPVDLKL